MLSYLFLYVTVTTLSGLYLEQVVNGGYTLS